MKKRLKFRRLETASKLSVSSSHAAIRISNWLSSQIKYDMRFAQVKCSIMKPMVKCPAIVRDLDFGPAALSHFVVGSGALEDICHRGQRLYRLRCRS